MAGYLGQKANKITSSKYSSELQENRKPIPGLTIANTADSISDHARVLQNPAILDTLDTVHRSLLFNNLKFDTDEHAGLDGSSITDYSTLPGNQERPKEELLESSTINTREPVSDQTHVKVNIADASIDVRSSRNQIISQDDQHLERCGIAASTNEYVSLDDELEALFGKDWNNNINGESTERTSKVKMMVQQYEQKKEKVSQSVRTSPPTAGVDTVELCTDLAHSDVFSIGDAETSDFESASVTSGSSVCGDGGRRSVRTSSAFSEGSRDIASIDRFDLAMPTSRQQKQQEDLAGHNTMITININYRCDTNPLRTSKATSTERDVTEKNVDIMVSAPPQAVTETNRKTLENDRAVQQQTAERHVLVNTAEIEEEELMDLEKEQTLTDESEEKTNEVLIEDAGSESMTDCMPKEHRGAITNNRSCRTPDDEEYHDCDDLHESTLSFYEQACSQPVTPQESKKRSSGVNTSSGSSVECENDKLNEEQPMIQIVQELSEDRSEVTSKITLSKAQIRDMQKAYGARRSVDTVEELKRQSPSDEMDDHEKHEKRRKSHSNITTKKRHDKSNLQRQQRIIDDNFCNEILDSTIHFDRLYGSNRPRQPVMEEQDIVSSPSPTRQRAEECFSDSVVCEITSPGEESFDSVMSVGKLEGKPRYSGRTVGRLMMKRLKKLQEVGAGAQKMLDTSDASTSSSQQMSGPKKPPRTFANIPKRSIALPTPSCPMEKDVKSLDPTIGWKLDSKPRSHQVGWTVPASNGKNETIPAQIYSMLNYSEDEGRKQLIKTGNSKPAPQQSISSKGKNKYRAEGELLGPKLAIDTVDGTRTPSRRHSTSTDFERFVRESNVKSTPHRKSDVCSRLETRRRIEQFLSEERHQVAEAQRKLPGVDRRRRTTGGIFERRRQQQENFLDDARRTNHEPRRKKISKVGSQGSSVVAPRHACCPAAAAATIAGTTSRTNGKVEKRRTFRKAAILKRTRTLFEASKKKIWAMKRFETPKKQNRVSNTLPSDASDRDPNINRNSSAKKKYNLHHKHLGYTPVHLRCKTCGSGQVDGDGEEAVVPMNYRPTRQQPSSHADLKSSKDENKENQCATNDEGRRRKSGEENNRKSARISLNFAAVPQGQRLNISPVESADAEVSPRKTGKHLSETKFLKTLRNLKISPRRIFRFASQSSTALDSRSMGSESHAQGEFQSYDDLNLDNVANMGDFLSNIRRKIAEDEVDQPVMRRESLQQATMGRSLVPVDVHGGNEDPIYQEISPKANKMVLNEFISSETNKRYLMVNNDPNILYAMVESKSPRSSGRLVKARSLTNMHASVGVADPTVTSTPVNKPQNNTSKSHMKPSNRRVTMSPHLEGRAVGIVNIEERENSLYCTALSANLNTTRHRTASDVANGEGSSDRANKSFNATGSTAGSSIRRSLFTRKTSSDHNRTLPQQHDHSTDDSDISILQEEESTEEESSLESLPEKTPNINEPLIVRERVEDRLAFRKENEHFQQNPPASTSAFGSKGRYKRNQEDLFSFEKDIIVEEKMGGNNVKAGVENGAGVRPNLIVLKAHKSVQVKVDGNGVAPLGCFDTDCEIDSLRKYDDREIEELVHSLHDNVTLSDMGTLDTETTASSCMGNELDNIGYDTVDLALPVSRSYLQPVRKNLTIDTVDVSELISHAPEDSLSTGNLSPVTSSPSSGKMSTSSTAVMRNLKDKLRSSFRKSRTFIKKERQRIANYLLEDRSGSKSSSVTSSTTSSPRRPTMQKTHGNTIDHKQSGRTSERRKQESDIESDDMYQSFTQGSNSIATGSSMTELSSQHMNELMQQIIRQSDARKQLKQALAICRSTREFECSPELIEAERLLLVATQKETAVRNELNKIDYLTNGMTLAEGKRVGTVTLSNFEFPLKETAVRDAMFNYFYVVVCTYKHEVKATIAKERHNDGRVYFPNCAIQFKNLDANYEIKVEVFVLQLRKNVKSYSFESRYHLEKDSKRPLSCPSPSKKLREAGRMLSFRSNSPKTFDFDNEFSRFKSQGFLSLTSFMLLTANGTEGEDASGEEKPFDATYATARSNPETAGEGLLVAGNSYYSTSGNFQPVICRQDDQSLVFIAEDFKYLTLDSMAYTSNMVGKIGMNVRSEIRFDGCDMSGFLDVGEKVDGHEGITWSRRWCQMNGFVLEFWNYPQECQEKQPILYIDLVKCINERIELADRSICSRPRTVRVEIFSSRVAAVGASCNSSGIGSFRSSGRTTSPSSVGELTGCGSDQGHLRPMSPDDGGRGHNNVTSYLLAADTQSDLKGWLNELNRVVKFLKEWKI